jgi:hypothetical protein
MPKTLLLFPVLLVTILTAVVSAKNVEYGTPITITARLSLDKGGGLRIATSEVTAHGHKVTNAPLRTSEAREKELKQLAAQGKAVKLHGHFDQVSLHGIDKVGSEVYFDELDESGSLK